MNPLWKHSLLLNCILVAPAPNLTATCGGGGGGGKGGMPVVQGQGGGQEQVFVVPWKVYGPGSALPADALVHVMWCPTNLTEARASRLLASRVLSLYGARCVGMDLIPTENAAVRTPLKVAADIPQVVLVSRDGTELGRVVGDAKKGLDLYEVEKALTKVLDGREEALKQQLKDAQAKLDTGDKPAATEAFQRILEWKCLFPKPAKDAAKALKALGVTVAGLEVLDQPFPILRGETAKRVVQLMDKGFRAERQGQYRVAEGLYQQASALDPADPAPLRFLGELHRHHTGEWALAKAEFQRILAMSSDPLARSVALHGLGKMNIHADRFDEGLANFQQSLDAYPLALTYRNLAVYWNDRDAAKAEGYMRQALALEPNDPYTLIFSATYLASHGQRKEALAIAQRHQGLLSASYNLAAVYALLGEKERALQMLHRHFYTYERFDDVRAKEMHEARVDIVFQSLKQDPRFIQLTQLAKG